MNSATTGIATGKHLQQHPSHIPPIHIPPTTTQTLHGEGISLPTSLPHIHSCCKDSTPCHTCHRSWGTGQEDTLLCWELVHAQDHCRLDTAASWQQASWKRPESGGLTAETQYKNVKLQIQVLPIRTLCSEAFGLFILLYLWLRLSKTLNLHGNHYDSKSLQHSERKNPTTDRVRKSEIQSSI